jgi:hypothetical protein
MKPDLVTKKDLKGFIISTILFSAKGDNGRKRVKVKLDPVKKRIWYETTGYCSYAGPSLDEAINLYNKL